MDKDNELKIKPTNNSSVREAFRFCPMTIPIVTRKILSAWSYTAGPHNYYESLRDKQVVGVDCAYKLRRGYLETRCVFENTQNELKCPLVDSDIIKEFITNRNGVKKIESLGKKFRKDNPEI